MDEQSRKEEAEIRKLPISLLEFLPPRRWLAPSVLISVLFLLIFSAVLVFFCPFRSEDGLSRFQRMRMEHNVDRYESLWRSQGVSNYVYGLGYGNSWGNWEAVVHVEHGVATSTAIIRRSGSFEDAKDKDIGVGDCDTVAKLFSIIRDALSGHIPWLKGHPADIVQVTYDEKFWFPTKVHIRPGVTDDDADTWYWISDLTILEQTTTPATTN